MLNLLSKLNLINQILSISIKVFLSKVLSRKDEISAYFFSSKYYLSFYESNLFCKNAFLRSCIYPFLKSKCSFQMAAFFQLHSHDWHYQASLRFVKTIAFFGLHAMSHTDLTFFFIETRFTFTAKVVRIPYISYLYLKQIKNVF